MSDDNLPDTKAEADSSRIRDVRIVLWSLFQLVVLMPLAVLSALAFVLVPLALCVYFLYQGLGLIGTIAAIVLHISVLRLLTLFSRWCDQHRP